MQGLDQPRVSVKSNFRFESLNKKLTLIPFIYNLMIGYPKKDRENCPKGAFEQRNKETRIKI